MARHAAVLVLGQGPPSASPACRPWRSRPSWISAPHLHARHGLAQLHLIRMPEELVNTSPTPSSGWWPGPGVIFQKHQVLDRSRRARSSDAGGIRRSRTRPCMRSITIPAGNRQGETMISRIPPSATAAIPSTSTISRSRPDPVQRQLGHSSSEPLGRMNDRTVKFARPPPSCHSSEPVSPPGRSCGLGFNAPVRRRDQSALAHAPKPQPPISTPSSCSRGKAVRDRHEPGQLIYRIPTTVLELRPDNVVPPE